ncbi:MAG: hypothetical protein ACKVOJ_13550 [Sphingomonadaceae bacterium]
MRNPTAISAIILSVVAIAAAPVDARINQRQDRQAVRIANGISTGQLTAREGARLERQQAQIARYEARSRADGGGLSRHERARIETLQDRASRSIHNQRRDGQTR